MPLRITLTRPYLIFLGDVPNAKTTLGLAQWAPDFCIAQHRFLGCNIDAGLPDMSIAEAASAGAKSFLIGSAPVGGVIQDNWHPAILDAIDAGMDIVSGLHTKLCDIPELQQAAERQGVRLIDVRVPPEDLPIINGVEALLEGLLNNEPEVA